MNESVPEVPHSASDAALIEAVRRGDTGAYGLLYERHLGAARRAATALAPTHAEREDLVAEAFTRVLRVLRSGHGPTDEFRAYLLVTMRNTAINAHRRNGAVSPYADVPETPMVSSGVDPVGNRLHAEVAAEAFASLPERWRTVLWHTEVEGKTPVAVARILGMTPNGVAALAYRAREGLRRAYLQQHLVTATNSECRAVSGQLAGWVRQGISAAKMRRVTAHLNRCPRCRGLASDLVELNQELPAIATLLVLAAPVAAALTSSVTVASALSAVKATVTATAWKLGTAALIATTAVTVVATDPLTTPADDDRGVSVTTPGPLPPPPTRTTGEIQGQNGSSQPAAPGGTATDAAVPDGSTETGTAVPETASSAPMTGAEERQPAPDAEAEAKEAKKAEKAEKKAAKQEEKAEKKAAEQEARAEAKEAKKAAKNAR